MKKSLCVVLVLAVFAGCAGSPIVRLQNELLTVQMLLSGVQQVLLMAKDLGVIPDAVWKKIAAINNPAADKLSKAWTAYYTFKRMNGQFKQAEAQVRKLIADVKSAISDLEGYASEYGGKDADVSTNPGTVSGVRAEVVRFHIETVNGSWTEPIAVGR